MLVFASSITDDDLYRRFAEPGICRSAEPDSEVIAMSAVGSIHRSYNRLLDEAAGREGLEALVLLHQDTEIADARFCAKARAALADPAVGVVGCLGAIGVRSIAYWEGTVTWASHLGSYEEFGGGTIPGFSWDCAGELPEHARTGEVDVVDGFLLVLSPWVVRNVRFDESLSQLHGYDFDFCFQVREAGRKILAEDIKAVHHHRDLYLIEDYEAWIEAYVRAAEKWDGRIGLGGASEPEWKRRAQRAEAEAAAARVELAEARQRAEAEIAQLRRGSASGPPRL
jgi:hypothetical protein